MPIISSAEGLMMRLRCAHTRWCILGLYFRRSLSFGNTQHIHQKAMRHMQTDYLLHVKKNLESQLFIDRHVTLRRDGYSSGGVDHDEVEANQLGAALLMHRSLVRQEIKKNNLDLDDEEVITFLAKAISCRHSGHHQQIAESAYASVKRRRVAALPTCALIVMRP
jgi:hypothetical protein